MKHSTRSLFNHDGTFDTEGNPLPPTADTSHFISHSITVLNKPNQNDFSWCSLVFAVLHNDAEGHSSQKQDNITIQNMGLLFINSKLTGTKFQI